MHDLTGRVAIVTGAGSVGPGWGNGKATAVLLARQWATIFGLDVNDQAACVTRELIEKEGGTCAVHHCNMMDSKDVKAAVDTCMERFGKIDILINNVGGSAPGDPVSMSEEVWDNQIDFNLKCMVRRLSARGDCSERSYSLRKCIRPLGGDYLRATMMIRACRS
jgi:NAD(P)-dependent dehydrogenase (short-subunit alcohol dehydrogenase family)